MWQREAMWLNFEPKQHKWAVRVFMGHVNTISSHTIEETADKEVEDQQQDYIVIPGQPCGSPGQLPMAPIKDTLEIPSASALHSLLPEQVTEFSSKTESLDYNSEDNTKRELEVNDARDISAMGLAAGGKLSRAKYTFVLLLLTQNVVQDIYKDPYPATLWNHSAARILHVHILDPVSCEKVTHIVPRPPSMDAKAYTEASGQFFVVKEKVDERLHGGDFDNVKSVIQMDQQVGISTEPEFDPTKPKMCTTCELRLCDCM
ncbi:unnamed protein product [Alternaria alternata]